MAAKILRGGRLWILTIVVFVVLIVFFDRNSYLDRVEMKKEISELKEQRDFYIERIRQDSIIIEKLKDDDFLEQYARENFIMKRDEEVVYVVEP